MAALLESALTEQIIGAAIQVSNGLGAGFLEKVYHNALLRELAIRELPTSTEVPLAVYYRGEQVGDYRADLIVAGKVLVEVKAVSTLSEVHEAQLLNYLRISQISVGLLLNFGTPRLETKRLVL